MGKDLEKRADEKERDIPSSPGIIKVSKKYINQYVAFPSFNSKKIIAYGKDPSRVIKKARKRGFQNPVIMYIPDPDVTYIYSVA